MRYYAAIAVLSVVAVTALAISSAVDGPREAASRHEAVEGSVYANGVLEGQTRDIELRFELSGRLASIDVQAGQEVRQGAVLARLDDLEYRAAVADAEAQLAAAIGERDRLVHGAREETLAVARAEVQLADTRARHAELSLQRSQSLRDQNAVALQRLDDDRALHKAAMDELRRARAHLAELEAPPREEDLQIAASRVAAATALRQQALARLQMRTLRAPVDGVILDVHDEVGELLGPASERPVITMADHSQIHVRAEVEEYDALRVRVGQRATIRTEGLPAAQCEGTVILCAPYLTDKHDYRNKPHERTNVRVREVRIRLDRQTTDAELLIGQPVNVLIEP